MKFKLIVLVLIFLLTNFSVACNKAQKDNIVKNVENTTVNNETNKLAENEVTVIKENEVTPIKEKIEVIEPEKKVADEIKLPLKNRVICIDPGHQMKVNMEPEAIAPSSRETKEKMSWGTQGIITKVPEYKLNLIVSQKLKQELIKNGAKVFMTRETDDVNTSNIERATYCNSTDAEIVIRIHADGSDITSASGISVLYPSNKYINNLDLIAKSKKAAQSMLDDLIKKTGAKNRGLSERDDMTGFNWSTKPVILVEMGFMSNEFEDRRLNSEDYQIKIVDGMVSGLMNYFAIGGK